jgi:rod shape-determining protein MreC
MNEILAARAARRRWISLGVLLLASVVLMGLSSNPAVLELQRGVAFAFRPIQGALDGVGQSASSLADALIEVDSLRLENQALQEENDRLRAENLRLDEIRRENEQLTALLQLRGGFEYEMVTSQVVGRESSEFRRLVVVDRGAADGIELGDVAITSGGALVGRVVDVGGNYASILLLNDTGATVVGQTATDAATGEVVGQLGGVLVMRNIDATERVQLGEEVYTAGIVLAGGVRSPYPKGLLIGQVVDVRRDANAVVQTAYLQPTAPLDKVEWVSIITDYDGGLPAPEEQPSSITNPDGTLPEGEQPFVRPTQLPLPTPTVRP